MAIPEKELTEDLAPEESGPTEVVHIRLNPAHALSLPFSERHIMPLLRNRTLSYLAGITLLFIAYVLTARLGLVLSPVHTFASLMWLPSGIALATVFLYGYRLWPGIALGAFFINSGLGATPDIAIDIALGNTLEALVGAYLLRQFVEFDPLLARLRDSIGFLVVAFCATLISPIIGVGSLYAGKLLPSTAIPSTWLAWWAGDVLGVLVATPFIIRWFLRPDFNRPRKDLLEAGIVLGLIAVLSVLVFWSPNPALGPFSLVYLLFIPLGWGALRTGPRAMTLNIIVVSLIATSALVARIGTVPSDVMQAQLVSLQLFMAFVVILFLPLTSIVEDRKNVTLSLREKNHQLGVVLEKLHSEDEAKNEFMAILAHELRNPLAPVVSSIELLMLEMEKRGDVSHMETLQAAASHLHTITTLLEDLLDISRISRRKLRLNIETVEFQSVVNHAVHTMEQFYRSKDMQLSVSMPKEPIFVEADSVRLEQVVINVLHNAGKYTNPGGSVELSAVFDPERGVRISVRDNGIGMSRSVLEKIFDPFMQAADKHKAGGLGIGLYLTKRLVELHGGRIWAESAGPGKGSEFIIVLPVAAEVTEQPEAPEPQQSEPQRRPFTPASAAKPVPHRHRILLVDDNEAAAKSLSTLLMHKGHEVIVSHHGTSALQRMEDTNPDIALLDIGLPDMDGYTLARTMRELYPDRGLTLIALTGYGQEEDKEKSRKAGFDHHLTKPVGIADIEHILERL